MITTLTTARRLDPLDGVGSRLLPVIGGAALVTASATGIGGHIVARAMGLRPGVTTTGALTISQQAAAGSERWSRRFGRRTWSSVLTAGPADDTHRTRLETLFERAGPLTLRFDVMLDATCTTQMRSRSIHLGPIRLPTGDPHGTWVTIAGDGSTDVIIRFPGGTCGYHVEFGDNQ